MGEPLTLGPAFYKAHGHGNDYLVFEEGPGWMLTGATVREVCHPHRGVGADGIVALLSRRGAESLFSLRMFNPDGSEFERSGNGLRVLAAYLHAKQRVRRGTPFVVEVGGERVVLEILGAESSGLVDVAVEMGRARFGLEAVGGDPEGPGWQGTLPGPRGRPVEFVPVSVGNPHCVVLSEELTEERLLELGPFLTSHPAFPRGANVQLARRAGPARLEILIWERGVGRTASSGTSACAVAAAFVYRGLVAPGPLEVAMEGGSFRVAVGPEGDLRLEGPVRPIAQGALEPSFLAWLDRKAAGVRGSGASADQEE